MAAELRSRCHPEAGAPLPIATIELQNYDKREGILVDLYSQSVDLRPIACGFSARLALFALLQLAAFAILRGPRRTGGMRRSCSPGAF
jgi:hypothetical protein